MVVVLICLWATPLVARQASTAWIDFRLLMAQLSLNVGANGQFALLKAQGDGGDAPGALLIRGGSTSLAAMAAALPDEKKHVLKKTPDGWVLSVPVLVGEEARLDLAPKTSLILRRDQGAFIAVFGGFSATSARVSGTAAPNKGDPEFRPFLLAAGRGHLTLVGSGFTGLGFGAETPYRGIAVVNRGLFAPHGSTVLADNVFDDIGGVTLVSTKGAEVSSNTFRYARGEALRLEEAEASLVRANRFDAPEGHGIRVTNGSTDTRLFENTVTATAGLGILVDRGAVGATLFGNAVKKPAQSAIVIRQARCVFVRDTTAENAGGSGIVIDRAEAILIEKNTLRGNRHAGLYLSRQKKTPATLILGNTFEANRIGLVGEALPALHAYGNDFSAQLPRLLGGDLTGQTRLLATDLLGRAPVDLVSGAPLSALPARSPCEAEAQS
ncbi:MAG: right-handed parallel beta-helix repeat-containing protein [Pseudomonadota bacterium]